MATYRKRGSSWRAEVRKNGVRESKSFATKAQAVAWATQLEAEILKEKRGEIPNKTFGELMDRYAAEISPTKKGERWEKIRIEMIKKLPLAKVKLEDLTDKDFVLYRDSRLKTVSPASVNREFALLSHICFVGVREWKWLKENPVSTVRRPKKPQSRDRRISEDEIERILFASGYKHDKVCENATARVGAAFLFAIETAMRAGEILKLKWEDVDLEKRYARLLETKNGTKRDVPLSSEAIRIINQMPKGNETIFGLSSSSLDSLFRKMKTRCMIEDLHFHDTRHEAITRLSKKFSNVLDLARMVGHRDIRMLMVYYNETAEELAKKLE